MANIFTYVPYAETGYFSHLVTDYLNQSKDIIPFQQYTPDAAGLEQAIAARSKYPVNRKVLTDVLARQYANLPKYGRTAENIALLQQENTYTICTAHQPNLLTGYLYFIYKILHAIKLADELNERYPDKYFVPVYYMGSEDNDLEELGTFRFRGDKYIWDGGGQKGAVGRMSTATLKPLLNQLFKVMGPPGKNCDALQQMISAAYLQHNAIATATQYLVNELFGQYGLVVLNPDEAGLKALFVPVMEDELLHQHSLPVIDQQIKKLGGHYKIQAHPREINLFYLADQLRERIERKEAVWAVVNTAITWNKDQLIDELRQHPERFSPNVMLRGLFQETILPDVAFIGGGAEVAYWLQLKTLFAHYNVFYPAVLLRQSVLWIDHAQSELYRQLGLGIGDLFREEAALTRSYMATHAGDDWQTQQEAAAIAAVFEQLKEKAAKVDPTLNAAAEASLTRMKHQLAVLEQKMLRAEKRKMDVQLKRIARLREALFPGSSLQERVENFSEYYLRYGNAFLDAVKEGIVPVGNQFLVVEDRP